jgi:hypothetical protein
MKRKAERERYLPGRCKILDSLRNACWMLEQAEKALPTFKAECEADFETAALSGIHLELSDVASVQGRLYLALLDYQKLAPSGAPAAEQVKP